MIMKTINRRKAITLSAVSILGSTLNISAKGLEDNDSIKKKLKIIVVGAHPDDPETGCGGTMALLAKEGHDVISAYLTKGEAGIAGKTYDEAAAIRTEEALKACNILNVRPKFLGQIDGNCEITKDKYQTIYDFFEEEKPDIIFNHWPIDTHRDHRISSLLVYDAWLYLGKKSSLYYYEVMTGQQSQNFAPTNYVDITSFVKQKHASCFIHRSQKIEEEYPNSHEKMEIFRGLEFNTAYAEAYIQHYQSPKAFLL